MKKHSTSGINFFTATLLNLWLISGLYIDGWSHEHGKPLTSFFTPWHGIFYAGFFSVALYIVFPTIKNFITTHKFSLVYPSFYFPAILGVFIFSLGGIGDVIWHGIYGFETQIDAILSPTHLALYMGMYLIFISTLNALIHQKTEDINFKSSFALALSITIVFSFLTFLTQYANPLISPFAFNTHQTANNYYGQTIGLVSLFMHTTFLIAPLLFVLSRRKLLIGSLTLIFTVNAVGMSFIHDHRDFILSAILAGVVSDFVMYLTKPSLQNSRGLQIFSILIPSIYCGFYFLVGNFTRGIWWTGYLWIGAILLAGFFGWMVSSLILTLKDTPSLTRN